jgi:hypothetical protein
MSEIIKWVGPTKYWRKWSFSDVRCDVHVSQDRDGFWQFQWTHETLGSGTEKVESLDDGKRKAEAWYRENVRK